MLLSDIKAALNLLDYNLLEKAAASIKITEIKQLQNFYAYCQQATPDEEDRELTLQELYTLVDLLRRERTSFGSKENDVFMQLRGQLSRKMLDLTFEAHLAGTLNFERFVVINKSPLRAQMSNLLLWQCQSNAGQVKPMVDLKISPVKAKQEKDATTNNSFLSKVGSATSSLVTPLLQITKSREERQQEQRQQATQHREKIREKYKKYGVK